MAQKSFTESDLLRWGYTRSSLVHIFGPADVGETWSAAAVELGENSLLPSIKEAFNAFAPSSITVRAALIKMLTEDDGSVSGFAAVNLFLTRSLVNH